MTIEGTTTLVGSQNATAEKPPKAAAKRKPKAAKSKGKGKQSARAAKGRQKRSGSSGKASGNAKTTPYRVGSCYMAIIDAIRKLGTGKVHSWEKIVGAVELPKGFKGKEKRTDNGLSWKDRVVQNTRTLARKDYGKPCRQVLKMEVRTDGSNGAGLFKI